MIGSFYYASELYKPYSDWRGVYRFRYYDVGGDRGGGARENVDSIDVIALEIKQYTTKCME